MHTYDFQIQYKKGATLPDDFLSRDIAKGLNDTVNNIDPFGLDLQQLQNRDKQLIFICSKRADDKPRLVSLFTASVNFPCPHLQ